MDLIHWRIRICLLWLLRLRIRLCCRIRLAFFLILKKSLTFFWSTCAYEVRELILLRSQKESCMSMYIYIYKCRTMFQPIVLDVFNSICFESCYQENLIISGFRYPWNWSYFSNKKILLFLNQMSDKKIRLRLIIFLHKRPFTIKILKIHHITQSSFYLNIQFLRLRIVSNLRWEFQIKILSVPENY